MPSTERGGRPSALVWLIAVVSLVLPIVGVVLALYGLFGIFAGGVTGLIWFGAGVLLLVLDLVIDRRWSYSMTSSEPDLNRRGEQIVGQIVTVVEPILPGGRGAVRAADSIWVAEGVEAEVGARVRVAGCKGTVLTVDRP